MPDGDARWTCCDAPWPGPHVLGCNASSYIADANPPVPTRKELEVFLTRKIEGCEALLIDYPDGEIVEVDSRSITIFDVESVRTEIAMYRACLDLVRERNVGIRCEGCGKAWIDDGESWQSWEDAWTCPACSE